jgi:hypothetical protein
MIRARRYRDEDAEAWDAFVRERSRNGTFLHTRRFLAHDPRNAGDDASLVLTEGERIVGVVPAALVPGDSGLVLWSHPRATYGGLVVEDAVGVEDSLGAVDQLIERARELGATEVVVRQPFRIFHHRPCDELDFALWHRGFTTRFRELEVAIPLAGLAGGPALPTFAHKTRNQTRKAHKSGVEVRPTDDYAGFWAILEAALAARHAAKPTHDLASFERLRASTLPHEVTLFGAFLEGRLIAGIVVFAPNARAVHAQYIAHDDAHSSACPVNALVEHIVEWAARSGYQYFNLGMATENRGRDVNLGLYKFKEGFGARGVLRETLGLVLDAPRTDTTS